VKKLIRKNLKLYQADCLTFLSTLKDNSVDLIATDPPYFKVKGDAWDNQWKNKAEFFEWLSVVLAEYHRVLKPNGSIYLFAGPHLATEVEAVVVKHFSMLNHVLWRKPSGRHNGCCKESLRKYFPQTEHIMFAESKKSTPFVYEPIMRYLENARLKAGVSRAAIDKKCKCQMTGHWFGKSQWSFPSEKHYNTMNRMFGGVLKPYATLKKEYKAIKETRRTFNVTKDVPYTNVWDFKPVQWYEGKHPCEKPLDLMEHIITASSRPGDVVLDTFTGSASTAIACKNTGRKFIGCEMGNDEFEMAVVRLNK